MNKPFHLMTPAERTAARIAENRAISEKISEGKNQRPLAKSTGDHIRMTPEERAKLGGVIRKVAVIIRCRRLLAGQNRCFCKAKRYRAKVSMHTGQIS